MSKATAQSVFESIRAYVSAAVRKQSREDGQRVAELERRLAELEEKNVSLERRLSRHAEHLQNLESKFRKREG